MIDIEKILKNDPMTDDYRIVSVKTKSYETFFVHRKLETVRATDTVSTNVTVYVRHDDKIGESSFALYESMTDDEAAAKVSAAASRARLVFNEPYEIPSGDKKEAVLESNFTEYEFSDLAAKTADAVFAADCYADGSINATEIFIYEDTVSVKNSRGMDRTQIKRHAMIEAIPTWNADGESVELYEDYRFAEFDAAKVTAEIDSKMREVRDRKSAVKPKTPLVCNVVLKPNEIDSLFSDIARHMNFAVVYSHTNVYNIGDDLQKDGNGDKIELTATGALKGSTKSSYFDSDGLELGEKQIISGGKVTDNFGASRFAQYLGKPTTGDLRCIKLAPGTLTEKDISAEPYIECVSLSGLQLDIYNDYIGGEIRLAYYYDGEKTVPVTGISMSAKLSEVLKGMRLSGNVTVYDNYEGPDRLLMHGVSIL